MKFKNILFTLLVALVAVLGVTVNAESTAPGSYTVRFKDLHRLSGANYFSGMNFHFYYKVNKDGKVTIKDIMLINNSILGKSKLTQ